MLVVNGPLMATLCTLRVHLYWSENDVASDLLHCFQCVCLYYSDVRAAKDQRKIAFAFVFAVV